VADDFLADAQAMTAPSAPPPGETAPPPAPDASEAAPPAGAEAATPSAPAPATAPAAPPAPPAPPATPSEYEQARGWLQQQSAVLDQRLQALQGASYRDQLELETLQRYGAYDAYNQRATEARAAAAERMAEQARIEAAQAQLEAYQDRVQTAAERAQLEGPSQQLLEYQQHQRARTELGEAYNAEELHGFLARYGHPPSYPVATDQYITLKLQHVNAQRAASGADFMGGTGGAAPPQDLSKLDENELFRMDAAALRRRR
jgi:hypothetical protein